LDGEDAAAMLSDTLKEDAEKKEPKSCPQQIIKVIHYTRQNRLLKVSQKTTLSFNDTDIKRMTFFYYTN
jgi:hypothetical protein